MKNYLNIKVSKDGKQKTVYKKSVFLNLFFDLNSYQRQLFVNIFLLFCEISSSIYANLKAVINGLYYRKLAFSILPVKFVIQFPIFSLANGACLFCFIL